jgi:hypothetical protein
MNHIDALLKSAEENAALLDLVDRLREWMDLSREHHIGCKRRYARIEETEIVCTCGLDALLLEAKP